MTRLLVVDHGAGNLVSIAQGLAASGARVTISFDPADLVGADGVVLPGVGASATVMDGINAAGWAGPLRDLAVPLLGICVGMQVLFDWSEEDDTNCLGLVPGAVTKLMETPKLPHIGWNDVASSDSLLAGTDGVFYFVHSYAPVPEDPTMGVGTTSYGKDFCSVVSNGPIHGVQFHPERSGAAGLRLLANFVSICAEMPVVA